MKCRTCGKEIVRGRVYCSEECLKKSPRGIERKSLHREKYACEKKIRRLILELKYTSNKSRSECLHNQLEFLYDRVEKISSILDDEVFQIG